MSLSGKGRGEGREEGMMEQNELVLVDADTEDMADLFQADGGEEEGCVGHLPTLLNRGNG